MKKLLSLFVIPSIVVIFAAGCASSSKPVDSSAGDATLDSQVDMTNISALPERGNFNPETDVDYNVFNADGMNSGTIYFGSDRTTIQPDQRMKLDKIAAWMSSNSGKNILIAGHCDDRGTLEYNRSLGERRAIAVRDYLVGLGVSSSRMHTHSYGEEKPAAQGSGDAVWSKNRRCEVGVVTK